MMLCVGVGVMFRHRRSRRYRPDLLHPQQVTEQQCAVTTAGITDRVDLAHVRHRSQMLPMPGLDAGHVWILRAESLSVVIEIGVANPRDISAAESGLFEKRQDSHASDRSAANVSVQTAIDQKQLPACRPREMHKWRTARAD